MQCPQCGEEWPDRFKVCPVCAISLSAEVSGSGAIAQGEGAAAAGEGGVAVGGDVHGSIYVGAPPQDPAEALRIYCQVLIGIHGHLPLRGIDIGASDPMGGHQRLGLAQVYVDLDTTAMVAEEIKHEWPRPYPSDAKRFWEGKSSHVISRRISALQVAIDNRHLVILGDPGSGKSTFVKHLVLCLAAHRLEPERSWLSLLANWPDDEADVIPIPVMVRDLSRWLSADLSDVGPHCIWEFIVHQLNLQNLDFAAELLQDALEQGKAIILLDGLDEVPSQMAYAFVRDAIESFVCRYPRNRVVATCRVLSYQQQARKLAGFPAAELASFDQDKMDRFVELWYNEQHRLGLISLEDAARMAQRLRESVRVPDLGRLATNPLLLTVMALVHTHKGCLPDARAMLYEDTVDILLWRWEQIKAGGDQESPALRRLLLDAGRTDVDVKWVLWQLAFEAHKEGGVEGGEGLGDIDELTLELALARLHPEDSRDWAHRVIELIRVRAGLLLERLPHVYAFPHRTFQEYLAGAHLSTQADFARQATRLFEEGLFWREAVLLAVGRLVYLGGDMDKPLALVGELCPTKVVDTSISWQKVWLAGDVLLEAGLNRVRDSALGQDLMERLRHRLAHLVSKGKLGPAERATAGDVLARLGDPRPGVGVVVGITGPLPDIQFCHVPAGPFQMGEAKERHLNDSLNYDYYIARYPITVAQFQCFVTAGGYDEARYWPEAQAEGAWRVGRLRGFLVRERRDKPYDLGEPDNLPNHPVAGLSWYEALAFCRWLDEQMRDLGYEIQVWFGQRLRRLRLEADSFCARLPSEAEWEKAARGTEGQSYPWGEEAAPQRANYQDTGIESTSAVGCFPEGASPYVVHDLSGNVWEWCQSLYEAYPYSPDDGREDLAASGERVLRGGSFPDRASDIRCAYRGRYDPEYWYGYNGFRVVMAPQRLT
jgi:formylglycine-generating enzyme required for sulfatase activity